MNTTPNNKGSSASKKKTLKSILFGTIDRVISTISLVTGILSLIASIATYSGINSIIVLLGDRISFIRQYLTIFVTVISIGVGLSVVYFGVSYLYKRQEKQRKLAIIELTIKERDFFHLVETSVSELLSEEAI